MWDIEKYFKAAHILDGETVSFTSMYISGDVKLWWRTRMGDKTRPLIETWDTFKKELKDQFLPCNSSWIARESLRHLKHIGTMREYVKQFGSLLLDIKNMSKKDKLFNFKHGLQN